MSNSNKNYVAESLNKEEVLVNNLIKATVTMMENDECVEILSNKKRKINAYRDDKNDVIYIFDKFEGKITVYVDEILDFEKKETTEKIVSIKKSMKDNKIYKNVLFVFDTTKDFKTIKVSQKEFEEKMLEQITQEDEKQKFINEIANFKFIFGKNYLKNEEFLSFFNLGVTCSRNVYDVKTYIDLLFKKEYIEEVSDELFRNFNKKSIKDFEEKIDMTIINMNTLMKSCQENKLNSYEESYEWNDCNNHIWSKGNRLYLHTENLGFCFNIKDDKNFEIYNICQDFFNATKEFKKLDNKIDNGKVDEFKDIFLVVKEGKIKSINSAFSSSFELYLNYACQSMENEGLTNLNYPVDIKSYEYQRDYFYYKFKLSEFEFVANFLMNSSSNYDEEKGFFYDSSVTYIPNLPKAPDTKNKKIDSMNYLIINNYKNLNNEWLDALKFCVEVLKRDRPKPVVFYGAKNSEEAIDNAIKHYAVIIKNNKKQIKKKI